jgi:hypothetical protein
VADPRDVGKCSGTTLVALTAALSIRGLGHPPLVELLLRQLLDRDLVDFNPSVVRGSLGTLQGWHGGKPALHMLVSV